MVTYFNILAWRIPWAEEPGGLESIGLQRVRHGWVTNIFFPPYRRVKSFLILSFFFWKSIMCICCFFSLALLFLHRTATQHGPCVPWLQQWACDWGRPITALHFLCYSEGLKGRHMSQAGSVCIFHVIGWMDAERELTVLLDWEQPGCRLRASPAKLSLWVETDSL